MAKTHSIQVCREKNDNLTVILVSIFLMVGLFWGATRGIKIGAEYGGLWLKISGGIMGAILGVVVSLFCLFLMKPLFSFIAWIKRIVEPDDMICRCQELQTPIPKHLIPDAPIQQEAVEESYKLMEWPEFARIRNTESLTADMLKGRLAKGVLCQEQIALAASLGNSSAASLGIAPIEPLLNYTGWSKQPNTIDRVLLSGLPPRLCMVWALSCVERVLPVFEREFHQDTRPRQIFGAALQVLKENKSEGIELCNVYAQSRWETSDAGCRVVHRTLKERMKGVSSLGEKAAHTMYSFVNTVSDYIEPQDLWTIWTFEIPFDQNRCILSQPCYHAKRVTQTAYRSMTQPHTERQWQREELIRLILGWERWNEDRREWQKRVDEEWVPRIQTELKDVIFDMPAYVELVRNQLAPWRNQGK